MAKTFAGDAVVEVAALASRLREVGDGFAVVTSRIEGFASARERNAAISVREVAIMEKAVSVATQFNAVAGQNVQLGQGQITTGSPIGGGVLASSSMPSGGGVLAGVNAGEIGAGVVAAMGRSTTAGERGIKAAVNTGFARLEGVIKSTSHNDGGAAFRANGGV